MKPTAGVYQIVNTINGKKYVGSSVNIERRWAEHKSKLNTVEHSNPHLQNAWQKYGEENFEFEIICSCLNDKTLEFEQFFLDARHPEYNVAKDAKAPMLGRHHTEEARKKNSEAHKGTKNPSYGRHPSAETKRKMSEANKNPSEETRRKISEAKRGA